MGKSIKKPKNWKQKVFTAFFKNGTTSLIEGKNTLHAYKKLGLDQYDSQIVDFYVEGDFREKYKYINNEWKLK